MSLPKLWPFHEEAESYQLVELLVAWYGLSDGPIESSMKH